MARSALKNLSLPEQNPMSGSIKALFASLMLLAAVTWAQALPPQRVVLEYDMSHNGTIMAQVVDRLEHDGKTYSLSEEVKGKGVYALVRSGAVRRSARGTVGAEGLKPVEFRDKRGNAPENMARFDWDKASLIQGQEGKGEAKPMPAREQLSDRLSFLWSFAFLPADAVRPGKEIRAVLTDGKGLSTFRYVVSAVETLNTPAGPLQTVKLVKQRESGDDRATEIWLATERNYLPVRILVVEKDGARIDQILTRMGV